MNCSNLAKQAQICVLNCQRDVILKSLYAIMECDFKEVSSGLFSCALRLERLFTRCWRLFLPVQ